MSYLADRKRVADVWIEVYSTISEASSRTGSDRLGSDEAASLLMGGAASILAAVSMASVTSRTKTGGWLKDAGVGAIELISAACELIFRNRLSESGDEGPDDVDPLGEGLRILERQKEAMADANMRGGFISASEISRRRALQASFNPLSMPARNDSEDVSIRDEILSFEGKEASAGENWDDAQREWFEYATDLLPDLVGSGGSAEGEWLAGSAALLVYARGQASTFSQALSVLSPNRPERRGAREREADSDDGLDQAVAALESIPGLDSLVERIGILRAFDGTARAREEKELLRRSVPFSVFITPGGPTSADPRRAAMRYAEALERLTLADSPSPLSVPEEVLTLVSSTVEGSVKPGNYLVDFEDLKSVLTVYSGSDSDLGRTVSKFAAGLRATRQDVVVTVFDRRQEAESFLNTHRDLEEAIFGVLKLGELKEEQATDLVIETFREADYRIEPSEAVLVARVLGTAPQDEGFGFEERLEAVIDRVALEHGRRVGSAIPGHSTGDELELVDVDDVTAAVSWSSVDPGEAEACLRELDSLIGLEAVKEEFRRISAYVEVGEMARELGLDAGNLGLNFLFLGNPGTGKTTVAEMMARMLASVGAIQTNRLVVRTPGELQGRYLGSAGSNLKDAVREALGGVLLIDDAYALVRDEGISGDRYGVAVLDELVNQMTRHKGRLTVILAGYEHQMELLLDVNPGLRRRFAYRLNFQDFTPEELFEIFLKMATDRGLIIGDKAEKAAREWLDQASREEKDFGNAGGVENLLVRDVVPRQRERVLNAVAGGAEADEALLTTIEPEDILSTGTGGKPILRMPGSSGGAEGSGEEEESPDEARARRQQQFDQAMAELDAMVGLANVKARVREIAVQIIHRQFVEEAGEVPKDGSAHGGGHHMVFTGNPGTGKTTVAGIVARIFAALGLIRNPQPKTVSGLGLTADWLGQTKSKVSQIFGESRERVLFIDEAYGLTSTGTSVSGSSYAHEAVSELVMQMDQTRKKVVVIAAGYPEPMEDFLSMNPGLKGRFNHFIEFEDYSDEELTQIAINIAKSQGFEFDEEAVERIGSFLGLSRNAIANFSNGRAARQLVDECLRAQAARLVRSGPDQGASLTVIEANDVDAASARLIGDGKLTNEAINSLLDEASEAFETELELSAGLCVALRNRLEAVAEHAAGEKSLDPALDLLVISPEKGRIAAIARVVARFLKGVRKLPSDEVSEYVVSGGADSASQEAEVIDALEGASGGTLVIHNAQLLGEGALLEVTRRLTRKDLISIVLGVPTDEDRLRLSERSLKIRDEVEEVLDLGETMGIPVDN